MSNLSIKLLSPLLCLSGFLCAGQFQVLAQSISIKTDFSSNSFSFRLADMSSSEPQNPEPRGEIIFLKEGDYDIFGGRVQRDSSIVYPDGFTMVFIRRPDLNFIGVQFILPDGQAMKPGQIATRPNGRKIIQPRYPQLDPKAGKKGEQENYLSFVPKVDAAGRLVLPNGLVMEPIIRPELNNFVGVKFILPDGTHLLPGQEAVLPNGQKIVQPIYPQLGQEQR
jgi:hypothetical protein